MRREHLDAAIQRARDALLARQHPEGFWVGELEADVSVPAGYVLLMHAMELPITSSRRDKIIRFVMEGQRDDGAWPSYGGGPGDLNVSVQAYFGMKVAGVPADDPAMRKAKDFIVSRGGIDAANLFTRIWLAVFGQLDWDALPSIPPELMLLPDTFPINIYEFASWTRETLVALMVVLARRRTYSVPETARIDELRVPASSRAASPSAERKGASREPSSVEAVFAAVDALLKRWERLPIKPGRDLALRKAEAWIVARQEADGSWGGIMLPWIYSLLALESLGYAKDHPVMAQGLRGLESFVIEDEDTFRLQPATSPVWDTAWSILALRAAGLPEDHPALVRAAGWLLAQEVHRRGDWRVKNPRTEPGGWSFEFVNAWYPDLDDTPVVARALRAVRMPPELEEDKRAAIAHAVAWLSSMQSRDGGWAAFDVDNDRRILAHLPFADFVPPLDPTCADVTAHVLELLAELGGHGAAVHRALEFLRHTQEPSGAWYGRWGVNYLYGTGLTLGALGALAEPASAPMVQRAVQWIESRQSADGGWGETCRSYEDPDPAFRGRGPSTASQTAWALVGLGAVSRQPTDAMDRAVAYLVSTQRDDGEWEESAHTGTGFPGTFYLRYDLYRLYFPLLALARHAHGRMEATKKGTARSRRKHVLFGVHDWGLGHATRDLPLVRALIEDGHEVTVASAGPALRLMRDEMGERCEFIEIGDIPKPVGRRAWSFYVRMSLSLPRVFETFRSETELVESLRRSRGIDLVVSDTRFGLSSPELPTFQLLHQLHQVIPWAPGSLEDWVERRQQRILRDSDRILIPDVAEDGGLAGALCHQLDAGWNGRLAYIGILSSVEPEPSPTDIDCFVSLSGVEPQRSMLERAVLSQAHEVPGRVVVTLGRNDGPPSRRQEGNVTIYRYMDRRAQQDALNRAKVVVTSSGYTTLMELAALGKKALLVPTEGMGEQRYLAERHSALGHVHSVRLAEIRLGRDVPAAARRSGLPRLGPTRQSVERFMSVVLG